MIIYLSAVEAFFGRKEFQEIIAKEHPYILLSFINVNNYAPEIIPSCKDFMMDSGAFTYRNKAGNNVDWIEYINRYSKFIKEHKIKNYFELDIDNIVGYDKVKEFRQRLEQNTGIAPIPVWHTSRGLEEYSRMCEEYSYVAIGGIVGGNLKMKNAYEKKFPYFIKEAHKNNCKIHGLGYTSDRGLKINHFDSVDSSSWLAGNKFGFVYNFQNGKMNKINVPPAMRIKKEKSGELAIHNFKQWIEYQRMAERKY